MRFFVTGGHGFVGRWIGVRAVELGHDVVAVDHVDFDVCDPTATRRAVEAARPDVVVHLAAQSSVARSFEDPVSTYRVNVLGTASVLDAVRRAVPSARVLVASSAEVYGDAGPDAVLSEDRPPRPSSPYAASKVAQEAAAAAAHAGHGVDAVIVRCFNLVGPGQAPTFALPSFADQLAGIALGRAEPVLRVGNLEARRDMTDVRDAAEAYIALGTGGVAGDTYNLCSGRTVTIREALNRLVSVSGLAVRIDVDPTRLRPSDIACLAGSNAKLRDATGWAPSLSLESSMRDLFEDALARAQDPGP